MLGLLVQLELKRQALRKRVLAGVARGDRCLTLGGLVFLIAILATPALAAALGPLSILAGGFLILGGLLTLTLVFAPVGLILL